MHITRYWATNVVPIEFRKSHRVIAVTVELELAEPTAVDFLLVHTVGQCVCVFRESKLLVCRVWSHASHQHKYMFQQYS